jgi:archaemetzincin
MRALLLSLLALSTQIFCSAAEPATIAIQPLGEVRAERLEVVRKGLETAYAIKIVVLPTKPLPKEAWYVPRQRYRADALLDHLSAATPEAHQVVIGLTAKDISVTKDEHEDWGIFGLGQLDGRVCVVSTFRLGARGADEAKLRERLRKVAIHEVGHVMGLPHCEHESCVMRDAVGSIATVDGETGAFCAECDRQWRAWLKRK